MPPPKTAWGISRRIEKEYERALLKLNKHAQARITPYLESGGVTPEGLQSMVLEVVNSHEYLEYCLSAAKRMAGSVNREANQHWRSAAAQSVHQTGQKIREGLLKELTADNGRRDTALYEIIRQNAELIKTIPLEAGKREAAFIAAQEGLLSGRRSENIAKELQEKFGSLLEFEAKRIARTEVSKAGTALTQVRAQSVGLEWYVWRTSEDVRARSSHDFMEGVLVNWNDAPNPEELAKRAGKYDGKVYNPYHAGCIWNCRCYAEPVTNVDWLEFPVRVCVGGNVRRMGKREFLEVY